MNGLPALLGGPPVVAAGEFIVFGQPALGEEEIEELVACLRRRWIGTGPLVARFEDDFARYKGAPHAVAVSSCTAALHLALIALDIRPGDEVITTPMTFCATVNAILHAGATPVLADVDPESMNLDPERVAAAVTPRTRALLPVHFAGRCCRMKELLAIAARHGLYVIEDCAHAIETTLDGTPAGRFGDLGCFSFYATKNLTTGEGGMVLSPDEALASRIKVLALHGMSKDAWRRYSDSGYVHYQVVDLGFKYNLTDMAAALGIHQLRRLEANWERRRQLWQRYQAAFADLPCRLPAPPAANERHAYHLYTPLLDLAALKYDRDWVLNALQAENIGSGVHYLPITWHPYYQQRFRWQPDRFPAANDIGARTLSLPLSPALTDAQVDAVIAAFRKVLAYARR